MRFVPRLAAFRLASPPLAATALTLSAAAAAGPVAIDVTGPDGRPLAGAVVTVDLPGAPVARPRGSYAVEQRSIQFQPRVLIVPVGATVAFPNRDRVRHHVYSFSKAKKFDLKLYGREDNRTVMFDRTGPVSLGCNIHDAMSAIVFVTATPFAAQSDAGGRVAFDVPAGRATVAVWHPSIRAPGNMVSQPLAITAGGASSHLVIRR